MIFRRPSGDIFRLIHFGLHGSPLTPHRFQGLFVVEHLSLDLLLGKVPDLRFGRSILTETSQIETENEIQRT